MRKRTWLLTSAILLTVVCLLCGCSEGEKEPAESQGLAFELNEDGSGYMVMGIGTCTDADVVIPSEYQGKPVTAIGDGAFHYCQTITSVVIPDSVTSIEYSFYGCGNLESVTIPDTVTSVDGICFISCTKLAFGEDDDAYYVGNERNPYLVLLRAKSDDVTACEVREGTRVIGARAFEYGALETISIPNTVQYIGSNAFSSCWDLRAVYAEDVNAWMNISFENLLSRPNVQAGALYFVDGAGNAITEVVIPDGTTAIDEYLFGYAVELTSVTIPDSVTSIGAGAFSSCTSLTKNQYDNGYYLGNENTPYLAFVEATSKDITSCRLHESTRFVFSHAFLSCKNLTSVEIPYGVVSLDPYAFYGCESLASITIPDSVTSIGSWAFSNCTSLESVVIPDSVIEMDIYVFEDCTALVSATVGKGMTTVPSNIFAGCTSLSTVTISDDVTEIGYHAFEGCVSLESITLPKNLTYICSDAFAGCTSLKSITLPDGVIDIGYCAFSDCTVLETVVLPQGLQTIQTAAFKNCTSLTSIELPDGIQRIDMSVFLGCTSLTSIAIPKNVTSIESSMFSGCADLTEVVIPDGVTRIMSNAFNGCVNLESIVIPATVKDIYKDAFYECQGLAAVYYGGTMDQWRHRVNISDYGNEALDFAAIYYYSETQPADATYNWWYYNENGNPVAW